MKPKETSPDALLAQYGANLRLVLLYGPDTGLAHERARAWVTRLAGDANDPFRVSELSSGMLKDDPARLRDEAAEVSLTAQCRVVWVRDAGDAVTPAVEAFLDGTPGDGFVVLEAGDLPKTSKLRQAAEQSDLAAAIACYHDAGKQIADVIAEVARAHRLVLTPDAQRFLVDRLGGDRMVSRSELEKLALYAGPGGRVELADAMALVGDSADLSVDDALLAAFDGKAAALERALERAFQEGESPVAIVRAALRYTHRLELAAAMVAAGRQPREAILALRPPPFWRAQDRMTAQLRRWTPIRLRPIGERLLDTELACKSTGMPDRLACAHALLEIARAAG